MYAAPLERIFISVFSKGAVFIKSLPLYTVGELSIEFIQDACSALVQFLD